jgi:AraC family transcriptional regulator
VDRGDRRWDGGDGALWAEDSTSVAEARTTASAVLSATLFKLIADATEVLDGDHQARTLLERAAALLQSGAPERGAKAAAPRRAALAPWLAKRVAGHIDANLDRRLPLDELAGIAKLSNSHFSRAFKGVFGETPHAFIVCRRIERARREMLDGQEPLSRIAVSCGFADQAHLARLFRRATGLSPSEWRRANRPAVNRTVRNTPLRDYAVRAARSGCP